jgi:Rrf2 family nitric oxide-sensitive transcriptional repressor
MGLRITKHTDYALRALIYLAARPAERATVQAMAEGHGISQAHLQKIVRALAQAGWIELTRGVNGGAQLAVDPGEISIGAVMRELDDQAGLVECFRPETDTCAISPACRLKGALQGAQEAYYAHLDGMTLADVVRGRTGNRLRELTGG